MIEVSIETSWPLHCSKGAQWAALKRWCLDDISLDRDFMASMRDWLRLKQKTPLESGVFIKWVHLAIPAGAAKVPSGQF
jgi:hypothetical protein